MDNKLVISYSPEQIDEAVKHHIASTTGYTGNATIVYTHKRSLKKVSAEIELSDPVLVTNKNDLTIASPSDTIPCSNEFDNLVDTGEEIDKNPKADLVIVKNETVKEIIENSVEPVVEVLNNESGEFEPCDKTIDQVLHESDPIPDGDDDLSLNEQEDMEAELQAEIDAQTQPTIGEMAEDGDEDAIHVLEANVEEEEEEDLTSLFPAG